VAAVEAGEAARDGILALSVTFVSPEEKETLPAVSVLLGRIRVPPLREGWLYRFTIDNPWC
jgi:hypothetical protein